MPIYKKRYVVFALKGLFNSAQRQRLGVRIAQSSFPSQVCRRQTGDGKMGKVILINPRRCRWAELIQAFSPGNEMHNK